MALTVYLLAYTPSPDRTVAAAARLCYSGVSARDLLETETAEKMKGLIAHLRKSGHFSPFEHASFTFALDGLSRVASHQLVRHRIASYSQQSQRYVSMDAPDAVMPPSIAERPELAARFTQMVRQAHGLYRELTEAGIPREDARFILPHGWSTRLVMTMNARELHHFFAVRLCRRAQWEIRDLARRMLGAVRSAAPLLFETAGPSCLTAGKCGEMNPCGSPYGSMEELLEEESR